MPFLGYFDVKTGALLKLLNFGIRDFKDGMNGLVSR